MDLVRRGAAGAAGMALVAVLAGCSGGGDGDSGADAAGTSGPRTPEAVDGRSAVAVMASATEKTSEARSARMSMTMKAPGAMGGTVEMNGVIGWDPTVMDMTASGEAFEQASPDAPEEFRMIWVDGVMYMNAGGAGPVQADGKSWLAFDYEAMMEEVDDPEAAEAMSGGLQDMKQNPVQQMSLLLDSPNIDFVGREKTGGVSTRHYAGTLTLEEALDANKSAEYLEPEQREKFLETAQEGGIEGYDLDVWLNGDDLPVRLDMEMETPDGTVKITERFSDYGAGTDVEPPPSGDTFDMIEMLKSLKDGSGPGAVAGA